MRFGAALLAAGGMLAAGSAAAADFEVIQPYVTQQELELEHKGHVTFDGTPELRNNQTYVGEIEYGVTAWWKTGVEFEGEREEGPGNRVKAEALEWENVLQLTERGQYFADLGFFAAYEHGLRKGANEEVKFGPIVAKEIGPTLNTLNLFFEKDIGPGADEHVTLNYRWSTRLQINPLLEPGVEIHGEPGPVDHFNSQQNQEHRIGPVLYGSWLPGGGGYGKLQYQLGYLFGLTDATADGTLKWLIEYEIPL